MIEVFGTQIALDYKLALLLTAVLAGGIIRGFAGFGSALVIIPALAVLFGPRQAVAMELIIEIPVLLGLLPAAIRDADRSVVTPMCLVLVVSVPIGAFVLVSFNPELMKIGISITVLAMAGLLAMQNEVKRVLGRRGAIAAGALSGLIQGATGVGGPPGVTALLARGDSAVVSRANVIAFMNFMLLTSIVSCWFYGLMTKQVLVIGILASPVLLISVMAGMAAFNRWGDKMLRGVALFVVAISALVTLVSALFDTTVA